MTEQTPPLINIILRGKPERLDGMKLTIPSVQFYTVEIVGYGIVRYTRTNKIEDDCIVFEAA